jgi:hypothetical protein
MFTDVLKAAGGSPSVASYDLQGYGEVFSSSQTPEESVILSAGTASPKPFTRLSL